MYVAKAEDAWLEDVDGNRYLDFAGGIGCLNVGHRQHSCGGSRETSARPLSTHLRAGYTPYESYVRLAERMNDRNAGEVRQEDNLCQAAVPKQSRNAVKIAVAYTKRPGIIAFEDAFHGRTMMTLALTSKTHPYKAGFRPVPR